MATRMMKVFWLALLLVYQQQMVRPPKILCHTKYMASLKSKTHMWLLWTVVLLPMGCGRRY